MITYLRKHLSALASSQEGSIIILVVVSMFLLLTAVGVAVDMARVQTLQVRMYAALDAAGLAAGATSGQIPSPLPSNCPVTGGQSVQLAWVQCQAQRYFNANFQNAYVGGNPTLTACLSTDGLTCTSGTGASYILLNVSSQINTTLTNILGVTNLPVAASTQITLPGQNSGMELVLVLDNTESMNTALGSDGYTKLQALTGSAGNTGAVAVMLNTIFGGSDAAHDQVTGPGGTPLVWVGVVPFTDMVNLGKTGSGTIFAGLPVYSDSYLPSSYIAGAFPSNVWTGCVDARTPAASDPFYGNDGCANGTSCSPLSYDISLDTSPTFTPVNTSGWDTGRGASAGTGDITCPQPIVPIQSSQSAVLSAVSHLTAQGNTMIHIGLAWGWRMMNAGGPWGVGNWPVRNAGQQWDNTGLSGLSSSSSTASSFAGAYNTLVTGGTITERKVVVLMTDGANTDSGVQCVLGQCNGSDPYWEGDGCCTAALASNGPSTCGDSCGVYASNGTCNYCTSIANGTQQQTGASSCGEGYTWSQAACPNTDNNCATVASAAACAAATNAPACTGPSSANCYNYNPLTSSCTLQSCWGSSYSCQASVYIRACSSFSPVNPNAYMDLTAPVTPVPSLGSSDYAGQVIDTVGHVDPDWPDYAHGMSYMEYYISGMTPSQRSGLNPSAMDNATVNLCAAMKAQGITVYTIGFGTADGTTHIDASCNSATCATYVNGALLSSCATPGDYYLATSAASLQNVFKAIAYKLSSLRVSQ